jgi:hypothetical protein
MDINGSSTIDNELTNNKSEITKNETENVNIDLKNNVNNDIIENENNNNGNKNDDIANTSEEKKEILISQEYEHKEKLNKEYEKILKNNPQQVFIEITEETIENWKKILYKKIPNIINEDCNILNSEKTKENSKIVSNDIPRTRGREKILLNSFSSLLEYFINFYCNNNKILYKQGLSEIIAPFLLLKYKLPNIPYYTIYNLLSGFINTYATNYYYEKTCFSLTNSLYLLPLLLKYHSPALQNLFDKILINPEMYGTSWLLTSFCSKLQLHLLYHLMNKIIMEDDPFMFHFLIIALLINKQKIFCVNDLTMVPVGITAISIDSIEEIDKIYEDAIKLRENTPYSFRIFANLLEIFKYHCEDPKAIYEKYRPDTLLTLPIFPSEIFYVCYNRATKCPIDTCKNNTKNLKDNNEEKTDENSLNLTKCEFCDMGLKKDLHYILLDLRILEFEGQDEKRGFLPKVIKIEQKVLKSENFTESMVQRFNDDKGQSHLIFMTSKTDFFNEFENNFYFEPNQQNFFTIQTKTSKEVNQDLVDKISLKEQFKFKEYDNMKKLLKTLLENDFPYISYIYGGFEEIHEQISKYHTDIYLLNHEKDCEICELKKHNENNNSWFSTQFESFMQKSKSFIDGIELIKDKEKKENIDKIQKIAKIPKIFNNSSSNDTKLKKDQKKLNIKKLNIEQLSDLISNFDNIVKYCSLIKYKGNDFNENDNKGILIIQKYYLIIIKIQGTEKAEQIDKIAIKYVDKIEIKKNNIIIEFIDKNQEKFDLCVKFDLEQEAKKFLCEINKKRNIEI